MSTAAPANLFYRPAESVLFQPLSGDAVLLDLKSEHYFSLDRVGARIWQLLAETHWVDATVRTMLREFAVEESRLRADVLALVAKLLERGLLVATAEPPAKAQP
jgi:hypothetical protein